MSGDSNKTFVIGTVLTVVIFIVGVFLLAKSGKTLSREETLEILGTYEETNLKGNVESKVEIVEFSDFQCPACAQGYSNMKQIEEEYKDQIKIIFRHFPLRSIHPNAQLAAEAVQTAGAQGKFWELHDLLFEKQGEWSSLTSSDLLAKLVDYAQIIAIEDIEKFRVDLENGTYSSIVNDDYDAADQLGLGGTPTMFVNGEQTESFSYEAIKKGVDTAISENEQNQ